MLEFGDENDNTNASKVQLQPPCFYNKLIKFLFSVFIFLFFFYLGQHFQQILPLSPVPLLGHTHSPEVFLQLS